MKKRNMEYVVRDFGTVPDKMLPTAVVGEMSYTEDEDGVYNAATRPYPSAISITEAKYVDGVLIVSNPTDLEVPIAPESASGYYSVAVTRANEEATHLIVMRTRALDPLVPEVTEILGVILPFIDGEVVLVDGLNEVYEMPETEDGIAANSKRLYTPVYYNNKQVPLLLKNIRIDSSINTLSSFYIGITQDGNTDLDTIPLCYANTLSGARDAIANLADRVIPPGGSLMFSNPDEVVFENLTVSFIAIEVPELEYAIGDYYTKEWKKVLLVDFGRLSVRGLIDKEPGEGQPQEAESFLLPPGTWTFYGTLMILPLDSDIEFETSKPITADIPN